LMDVMPMPIIIAEPGGRTQKVIGRNTPVPHDATAVVDIPPNATSLKLAVFQGERARMDDNEYLGSLIIDEIPESDESRSCQIRMQLDAECLLTIHASIEGTQIDRELKLATQQTPDDVLGEIGAERIRTVRRSAQSDAQNPADAKGKKPKAPGPGWFARLFGWLRR